MATDPRTLRHYIDGELRDMTGTETLESLAPADPTDIVARVPTATDAEVVAASEAAARALPGWRARTGPDRGNVLYRWADAILRRRGELSEAVAREVGKPIGEARGEVGRCVAILRYYAAAAVGPAGDVIPSQVPGATQIAMRRPVGVAALITPWNFPLAIPLWKAAPALTVGNTVVLKPAEQSALCAELLAETASEAEVPAGVFNVLQGRGEKIGPTLLGRKEVGCASFTGSVDVGRIVATTCAGNNIKYQCEMGGKNVAIVLADADLDRAAKLVAAGAMRFAGQKCTATSRCIVDRRVEAEFVDRLKQATQALPVGDPMDPATAVGPVIDAASQSRLLDVLASQSATVAYQATPIPERGFFVPPTIYTAVDARAPLARDELFGPVLAVLTADGVDEALTLANDSVYGLSSTIFTNDLRAALTYVDRIEAGLVRINGDTTGVDPHAPFGGMRASSSHSREQGLAALDFYTDVKTVQLSP